MCVRERKWCVCGCDFILMHQAIIRTVQLYVHVHIYKIGDIFSQLSLLFRLPCTLLSLSLSLSLSLLPIPLFPPLSHTPHTLQTSPSPIGPIPPSFPLPSSRTQRSLSDQTKEEYREAAHRLYMEQERQPGGKLKTQRSSSPQPSSSKDSSAEG